MLNFALMAADVTDIALEWACRNVNSNPHIADLIEVRKVESNENDLYEEKLHNGSKIDSTGNDGTEVPPEPLLPDWHIHGSKNYHGPPVLVGVVRDDEKFDFCMCNPPFFESLEEAGLNPKTSCGGSQEEMVCPGGEKAFITRIIEDSTLKHSFRYYNLSMKISIAISYIFVSSKEIGTYSF